MNKNTEYAFPFEGGQNNGVQPCSGMTLRDYFAAKAVQSIVTGAMAQGARYTAEVDEPKIAGLAYSLADAMLAEREKSHD